MEGGLTMNKRTLAFGVAAAALLAVTVAAHAKTQTETQPATRATTFSSAVAFRVFAVKSPDADEQLIGQTPSPQPLEIPACLYWFVMPEGVVDVGKVCQEVQARQIPGLRLEHASDEDLAYLEGLTGLQSLVLRVTKVTDAGLEHLNPDLPDDVYSVEYWTWRWTCKSRGFRHCGSSWAENPMGEARTEALRVGFDGGLKLEFHGSKQGFARVWSARIRLSKRQSPVES
jgi:hypothetical protein